MKLLSLDTTTDACSVALMQDDALWSRYELAKMQQARFILPFIQTLLRDANMALRDLDAVAVTHGPGSLTGIRIGIGVAQAIAFAHDLPVIPISSLAVLAQRAFREKGAKNIVAAIDARMGQVYWGMYQTGVDNLVHACCEDALADPEDVKDQLQAYASLQAQWIGVGSGWQMYGDQLNAGKLLMTHQCDEFYPHAFDLLPLAKQRFLSGEVVAATHIEPLYLRNQVVDSSRR
ncbi:MAG: tRNA (adenosine(37)-N6)-threonylcarbamoyltransferase complex dimerization subunit type 1 TsaB [Pseudomonadota bacterium]|nr:tRNA (adenosine(37)-N6)-threonylcarbamoyltransferase complex dimerization subunit type 1 TsaB [Gammaproteobacteria bacterium]MBU1558229.1 tRNA (adenosine(37)-N6)-threonylcarbamoyltransferase complex dimerization subunit type 1 TsaB [Gammaproteobacteria bacterium]MBU1926147.1 tRNA (adenosine(37)-N6)-threonylcarbamoyltransferase complex dimerization subunit type 1 TsaB [Gammaproteobacteria bacterium]MBU2546079.1 tRNA (adenosine(37)-N6)-threonylcarbamoyltransferase complex dimerization subunit t